MKNKKRYYLVLLLLICISITSTFTFAYWNSVVDGTTADYEAQTEVRVGEGKAAATVVSVSGETGTDSILVPAGRASVSNTANGTPVEYVDVELQVKWDDAIDQTATGAEGTLAVAYVGTIGSTSYGNLVVVTFDSTNDYTFVIGETKTIKARVTLTEPATKDEYDAIINQPISVTFTFTVTPVND